MNTLKLLNGNTLPVYTSSEGLSPDEDLEVFLQNAFYFYDNRERIYRDSHLFLAKVPVSYGMDRKNICTLGGFLELWASDDRSIVYDSQGMPLLIFHTVGNPMTGSHTTRAVDSRGKIHEVKIEGRFIDVLKMIAHRQSRYHKAAEEALSYSIREVKELLISIDSDTCHSVDRVSHLSAELQSRGFRNAVAKGISLEQKLRQTRMLWKQADLLRYYAEAEAKAAEMKREMDKLNGEKRSLRFRYPQDARGKEFQLKYMKICKEIKDLKHKYRSQNDAEMDRVWHFNTSPGHPISDSFPTLAELSEALRQEHAPSTLSPL